MSTSDEYHTKSGEVLSDADLNALADEAERGYDPATFGPGVSVDEIRRWVRHPGTETTCRRDPHTVLRLDLLNHLVLVKYADKTTEWWPLVEYRRGTVVEPPRPS